MCSNNQAIGPLAFWFAVADDVRENPQTSSSSCRKEYDEMTDEPKRPRSAYVLWLNSARDQIKSEHPGLKFNELTKKGGEIWRSMKDKSVWEEKAAKEKDQYTKDLELYDANDSSGEGGVKKAQKRGKKGKKAAAPTKSKKKKEESDEEEGEEDEEEEEGESD